MASQGRRTPQHSRRPDREAPRDRRQDRASPARAQRRKRVGACLFHLKAKGMARDVATAGPYKGGQPRGIKLTAIVRFDTFGSITDGENEMPRPDPDDPSNLGDMLVWATILVCAAL